MSLLSYAEQKRSALLFVAKQQTPAGGFISESYCQNNNSRLNHQTIFYPALIETLLSAIKNTLVDDINKKIENFLQNQMINGGLWTYWATEDVYASKIQYPPDLDDTSLAVAVSTASDKLDTDRLVNYIQTLIVQEEKPGGPYYTWVTEKEENHWRDIDPIVNANIAFALKQQAVSLKNLNDYLVEKITSDKWQSPYYASEPMMLFLLERALNGQGDKKIREIIETWPEQKTLTLLDRALMVIILTKVNGHEDLIATHAKEIIRAPIGQACAADQCVVERQNSENREISGCAALTAAAVALACECLEKLETKKNYPPRNFSVTDELHDTVITMVAKKLNQLDHELFTVGLEKFTRLIRTNLAKEITLISFSVGTALGIEIPITTYAQLGAANLWGWLSYLLYDECYDEGDISPSLSLANICLREATLGYNTVAEEYHLPKTIVTDALDHIDMAHAAEMHDRSKFFTEQSGAKDWLTHNTLPLSERSFGHCLGAQLVCEISVQSLETQTVLKKMFNRYLNARQMCDDLHDWHEDYAAKRLTSVTKPLFLSRYAFPTANNDLQAQDIFWQEGITVAIRSAQQELAEARALLKKIPWQKSEPQIISKSLESLDKSLQRVLNEQKTMRTLIKNFS